ncbi:MAG: PEP/pyruvate-binding domain-containing protein [Mucinivorans sp.]
MDNNTSFASIDFTQLMQQRVRRIMLVCSSYDQFTLEEDGRIEAQITAEYAGLNLSNPPTFTRVSSASVALDMLAMGQDYDLIIIMFNIGQMTPFDFSKRVKELLPSIATVLLTSFSHEVSRRLSTEDCTGFDYVFGWQGNAELLLAIIKMVEDKMNADQDMLVHGVQGVLLIEDSVRFYSAYLTDLYGIMIGQTNEFVREALNYQQRTLRKRARPKVLFARTYSQAQQIYSKYKSNLLGVISDVTFKITESDTEPDPLCGVRFCRDIRSEDSQFPILLQSSNPAMAEAAHSIGADFIDKNSKTLLSELQSFISLRMAFGDFCFVDRATGEVVARAGDLSQLQYAVETMPTEVLLDYSAQNMFSKWLLARGLFALGGVIRSVNNNTFESSEVLREFITKAIKDYRRQMGQGVVAEFNPLSYNRYITFARSGNGSLGGKARGLAFVGSLIEQWGLYDKWEGVRLTIPRTLAVTTEHFERFMQENALSYIIGEQMDDGQILSEFMGSRLDEELITNLRAFLGQVKRPLAIRSSSKLEDSHYQPFAGVYSTYMVPRVDNEDHQLRLVAKAIKAVYASVFFASSRSYIEASGNMLSEESMAVVIQEICGTQDEGYYFPTISGVARSLNFYPLGHEKPEEGIAQIAFGLGKTVVEGGVTLRFSPAHPKNILQLSSPELTLRDTQRTMYALDLNPAAFKTSIDDGVNITKIDIPHAANFRNMRYVASTWDMQNQRISDSPLEKGRRIITFAGVLKYDSFPLAEILRELLAIGQQEMQSPVEIEFAVNMDVPYGQKRIFNFLQIRPIVENARSHSLEWSEVESSGAILYAQHALGLGAVEGVQDIIYVRPELFNAARSSDMAIEMAQLNERMVAAGRGYVLVGPGRWGSCDPWLGIPVKWGDISGSKVIVECAVENFRVDPSQGTHFFQNLTSFGVGYITMAPFQGDGVFDIQQLDSMSAEYESQNFRLVHFPEPLYIFVDGKNDKAIICNRIRTQ